MQIRLFATLKERAKQPTIALTLPLGINTFTVTQLRDLVTQQYPVLASLMPHAVVAINQAFAFDEDVVKPNDEIALFPPVSGGRSDQDGLDMSYPTYLAVTHEAIDLDFLQRQVTTELDGSAVLFIGTVRKVTGSDVTTHLEYEAYQAMAEAKLKQVADEMRHKFPGVHGVALVQRIGLMQAGEPTIAVVASSAHRGDGAFEAARYGIDRLKQIVPVWKKEIRPDGSAWIEGDYTPQQGD